MRTLEDLESDIASIDPDYIERTYRVRGKIISHFAMLEKNIEALISTEFSKEESTRRKMQYIIFDRMTFDQKRTSLRVILLERGIEKGFKESKTKKHPNSDLLKELQYLNTVRNHFAHYVTIQATNKFEYSCAIGLMDYRDTVTSKWYTNADIDIITSKIQEVKMQILNLKKCEN